MAEPADTDPQRHTEREGAEVDGADTTGYQSPGSRSGEPDAISDNRYREEQPNYGTPKGDIGGYQPTPSAFDAVLQDQPLFADSGFDTVDEYIVHMDTLGRQRLGLPAYDPSEAYRPAAKGERATHQVGLRLPRKDHELLAQFAEDHGLQPATAARMIVTRAVRAHAAEAEAELEVE